MVEFVQGASRGVLLALLGLWAALLVGGFVFGRLNAEGTRRMTLWGRLGSSLVLVVAAWCWAWFGRSTSIAPALVWIALGMSLGWVGDVCMAKVLPLKQPVIGGMTAFGLGHIAYIVGLLKVAQFNHAGSRLLALGVWLVLGAVGWYLVVWRGQRHSVLHRAALPYALLLASTAGIATGLAFSIGGAWLLVLGAALFLLSDLILATQLFNNAHWAYIGDVVWFTYGPAQMLIVFSMGTLLRLLG